jgi:hypothetical protein
MVEGFSCGSNHGLSVDKSASSKIPRGIMLSVFVKMEF